MKGVKFGNIHTYEKWGLFLNHTEINFPDPKKEKVDIPGSDGNLDFSRSLTGDIKYNNRVISFEFTTVENYDKWKSLMSEIANSIHGQHFDKIILDEDSSYYYVGEVELNQFKSDGNLGKIVIDCDVEPYKYDLTTSDEDWLWDPFNFEDGIINETKDMVVSGTLEIKIYGRRKRVVPKFVCNTSMQLIFNSVTYNLSSGTNYSPDIEIVEGENKLKFVGNGKVTVEYRGGSL